MANNRLYIVDKYTKEYVMIAKGWGCAWSLWDKSYLEYFLSTRFYDNDENSNLIIGHENDEAFYNDFIVNGINYKQLKSEPISKEESKNITDKFRKDHTL